MNSILARVLGHLKIADDNGWTPFVDMESHDNYYTELGAIHGSKNVWEYYFEPVSIVSQEEAYRSGDWIDSGGGFPHGVLNPLFSGEPWLPKMWKKYIRFRPETQAAIQDQKQKRGVFLGPEVLGIHFRGTDMRTQAGHPLPPTEKQIFRRIDECLDSNGFDNLFLVTEAEIYVRAFSQRYGKRLSYLDILRQGEVDIFVSRPRTNHRYILGLENIIETSLLSECGGLVSGYSGISEMAQVLNRDFRVVDKIWNGRVPRYPKLVSKNIWSYRQRAPRILGGFAP